MFTHHFLHREAHAQATVKGTNKEAASGDIVLPFIAMGLGVIILAQDFSSVNVALPAIERDLNSSLSTVQWVINAYALVFAMLIVAGGRFADLFGRKRVFFIGATIFSVMSLIGGFAPTVLVLILARALMGVGAALMWPAILGMTYGIVPKEKAGLAGGLILGAAGLGQALGPILGGALTELLSWRWTLFVNIPIAAFAMVVTYFKIHPTEQPQGDPKIDWPGIATLSLGLLTLLFGLDQAVDWGWTDPRLLGLLTLSALLFAAFFLIERRGGDALVPGDMMQKRSFLAACVATGLLAPIFVSSLLYIPQYLQKLLGASPLNSGLGMLPMMVLFAAVSFIGGTLYNKLGARVMVSGGALLNALGALILSFISPVSGYGILLVSGMILLGVGLGLFYSSVTTAGVSSVEYVSRTSLAGGLIYMFQIAGGAVGLGLTTTVVTLTADAQLRADLAAAGTALTEAQRLAMQGILAGTETAQEALRQFSAEIASRIITAANDAFVAGIQNGFLLGAGLAFCGFLVALVFLKPEAVEKTSTSPGA